MIEDITAGSIDTLEGEVVALESLIARARTRQAELLGRLDAAQVATVDGCRSMPEWTASRLDVTHDTARRLMRAAKGLAEHHDLGLPSHPLSPRSIGWLRRCGCSTRERRQR
jgi:hypothetical protein